LEISFKSQKLKKICEDENFALKHFPPSTVETLKGRLNDLRSAKNIYHIPPMFFITKPTESTQLILLAEEQVLAFQPGHILSQVSKTDWMDTFRVKIIGIQERHDN